MNVMFLKRFEAIEARLAALEARVASTEALIDQVAHAPAIESDINRTPINPPAVAAKPRRRKA